MLKLPMLAFSFKGMGDLIELTIDEVFGFPDETSYGGGYGAKGRLTIKASEYMVKEATYYFTTGELYSFMIQLKQCYDALTGTAILENTERELELECHITNTGHLIFRGSFQGQPTVNNILFFELRSDQTQLPPIISSLKKVNEIFGDNRGL